MLAFLATASKPVSQARHGSRVFPVRANVVPIDQVLPAPDVLNARHYAGTSSVRRMLSVIAITLDMSEARPRGLMQPVGGSLKVLHGP